MVGNNNIVILGIIREWLQFAINKKKVYPCIDIVYFAMEGILSARGVGNPPYIKQVHIFSV